MDWYAVNTKMTTGLDWLAIDPALRGHWGALMGVCAQRENGGILHGARALTAREWDRLAGMTLADLAGLERVGLVEWSGSDLVVVGYDAQREAKAQATSARQRNNAIKSWDARRRRQATAPAMAEATAQAPADATALAMGSTSPLANAVAEAAAQAAAQAPSAYADQSREEQIRKREEPASATADAAAQAMAGKRPHDPMNDFNAGRQMLGRFLAVVNRLQGMQYDASEQQFHVVNAVRSAFEKHGEQDVLAAVEWKLANRKSGRKPELRWIIADLPNTVAEWKNRRNGTAAPGGRTDFVEGDRA